MDIELLSKMIGELLPDHDEVGLPGLGAFMAEMVPASFSDKGYTINPPYRRVTFLPSRSDDVSLVEAYSIDNGIEFDQAFAIIKGFLEEVKRTLIEEKVVLFPGLGRLRATRQNNFFFITDEDLDIFPDGFGLEPVSLKNHSESQAEVRASVEALVDLVEGNSVVPEEEVPESAMPGPFLEPLIEPADTPESTEKIEIAEPAAASEPALAEPAEPAMSVEEPAPAEAPAKAPKQKRPLPKWLKITLVSLLIIVALAAVLLAAFVVLAQAAPDFIDSILYTREELEILNYR